MHKLKYLSSYSSKISCFTESSFRPKGEGKKNPQHLNKRIWFFIHNYIDFFSTFVILLLLHNYIVCKKLQQIRKNVKSGKLRLQDANSQRQHMVTLTSCMFVSLCWNSSTFESTEVWHVATHPTTFPKQHQPVQKGQGTNPCFFSHRIS